MARLNEPPISTDNLETLRRRFLRQNRDIARINSTQSLRIRGLENECSRLLSENLELRSQILRLEKELEDSTAQRVADHALDIKAKMEAQLADWGALLAGLGLEPPQKKRSPRGGRIAQPRQSISRSPAQGRPRGVVQDAEQEGRLPPIQENKSYPRPTMDGADIWALCSEVADSTHSPELGPPPVSRFVDEDRVKTESPIKPSTPVERSLKIDRVCSPSKEQQATGSQRNTTATATLKAQLSRTKPSDSEELVHVSIPPALRAGSKRKYGGNDENENNRLTSLGTEKPKLIPGPLDKTVPLRDVKNKRSIKELPLSRKEIREKAVTGTAVPQERKPLAAKSTNDDVSSPKKTAKYSEQKLPALNRGVLEREDNRKDKTTFIELPAPQVPPVVTPIPGLATPSLDDPHHEPDTPQRPAPRDESHDTPPPADISSYGETSRASRRARSAVSYAEPNLRDKMRRPTKELFDAVAGEGKYRRSMSQNDLVPVSGMKLKTEGSDSVESWKNLPAAEAIARDAARRTSVLSPLAQKEAPAPASPLPVGVTERRKRASHIGARDPGSGSAHHTMGKSRLQGSEREEDAAVAVKKESQNDVYDFTISSPEMEPKEAAVAVTKEGGSRRGRRPNAAHRDNNQPPTGDEPEKPTKTSGPRKRASIAAGSRKPSALDPDDSYEEAFQRAAYRTGVPDGSNSSQDISARDRISRRRSMML